MFEIPGVAIPTEGELPGKVKQRIEESVQQFEAHFGAYRIFVSGQLPGWVAEYRSELEAVARLALASKP